jgi:hypothetical protein
MTGCTCHLVIGGTMSSTTDRPQKRGELECKVCGRVVNGPFVSGIMRRMEELGESLGDLGPSVSITVTCTDCAR